MKVILVKSFLMEKRGAVTMLVHPEDYDCLKDNFERVCDVLSEPLFSSPQGGGEVAPAGKNIAPTAIM